MSSHSEGVLSEEIKILVVLSVAADLKMQGMPSFSRMMLPSFESATPSVFPSAFFFRNFLRSAWMASAQSRPL